MVANGFWIAGGIVDLGVRTDIVEPPALEYINQRCNELSKKKKISKKNKTYLDEPSHARNFSICKRKDCDSTRLCTRDCSF
jgi:hypothetical protein